MGELALSSAFGVVAGVLLAVLISSRRAGFLRDSAPLATLGVVAVSYVSLDFAGGSGYLGAFIAGLIVGNMDRLGLEMHTRHEEELRTGAPISDVVTIFVFLVVGASLPFATLADHWAAVARRRRHAAARRPAADRRSCARCPTGARAGPATSSPSCAGRARPASCPRRSSACSRPSARRTPS